LSTHRPATAELIRLFDTGSLSGLSEWELLEQYLARKDELAFEVLVSRHGPMVLGICRRMLRNAADVEDAFQATFLVLVRKAASLGPRDVIAGWLHGVAVRVAQQARSAAARRGKRERLGLLVEAEALEAPVEDHDLRRILDEEISRLPLKYRAPIVLCYLEGKTHEEAAHRLHWPLGTVKGRLSRARSMLESRLTRRGARRNELATLAAGSSMEAAVSTSLLAATCTAAARISSGTLMANVVSSSITQLIQGVLSAMVVQRVKLIIAASVISGLFLTGAGVLARQQGGRSSQVTASGRHGAQILPTDPSATVPASTSERTDKSGPVQGSRTAGELYKELIAGARRAFLASDEDFRKGNSPLERVYHASRLLMESERDVASAPAEKLKAVENHIERMQNLVRLLSSEGDADDVNSAEARAYFTEAQLLLAQARTPKVDPATAVVQQGKTEEGPGKDPKSMAVLARLDEPIDMSFANETPLEDVLQYIKQATTAPNYAGIQIYVDPLGLQEAEKTLTSTVQIDLHGIPLRRTLQLALKPLGLGYFVEDGILIITSQESGDEGGLDPTQIGPSPLLKKQKRLGRGEMTIPEMESFAQQLKVKKEIMKQLLEIQELEEARNNPARRPGINADQPAALLKEMKVLIDVLKAQRQIAKPEESK
jgi:RNA polymerase sigma factor (sigma-70 family)